MQLSCEISRESGVFQQHHLAASLWPTKCRLHALLQNPWLHAPMSDAATFVIQQAFLHI